MRLLIHAGIHRTGTTSLQHCLATNREPLSRKGILYPGVSENHQELAWAIKRGSATAQDILQLVNDCDTHTNTIVLSAEDFCLHKDLSWLKTVAAQVTTHVYFYLRRQDHWIMSWYNQHIKWPFDRLKSKMNPDEFLNCIDDFHWLNYAALIPRWQSILGKEAVHVSIVEPCQVQDVTEDFMFHLGIPIDELPSTPNRINDSMPVHLLEITRHLGLYEMASEKRIRLIRVLKKALPSPPDLPKTVYSPKQRLMILNRFAESNLQLARNHFNRTQLFYEPSPKNTDSYYASTKISHEEYVKLVIKPIIDQLLIR